MKNNTSIEVYNTKQSLEKYYRMQFCPFLKNPELTCATEPFYQEIHNILKPYLNQDTCLLEIGCGLGRIIFESSKTPLKLAIGTDISELFIKECKKIANNLSDYTFYDGKRQGEISFEVADAQDLPFKTGQFNLIVSLNVIDRVPNPQQAIQQIEELLAQGGIVLIADPYDWNEKYTHQSNHFNNMLNYFTPEKWEVLIDKDIPFNMQVHARKVISYSDHVLLLKRK